MMGFQAGGNVPPGIGAVPPIWNQGPRQLGVPGLAQRGPYGRPPIDIGALLAGNVPAMGPQGSAFGKPGGPFGPGAGVLSNLVGRANRCPRCGFPLGPGPAQPQPGPMRGPDVRGAIGEFLRSMGTPPDRRIAI